MTVPAYGGRLTLASGKSVQTSDQVGKSAVFYTPHEHHYVFANGVNQQFSELPVDLNLETWLAGHNYDFALSGDPLQLSYGPAWESDIVPGAAADAFLIGKTYVGSGRATANGKTSVELYPVAKPGGAAPTIGLYNAHNRKPVIAKCQDSTPMWFHQSSNTRAAHGSHNNRISFIDGEGVIWWRAVYSTSIAATCNLATAATIGIGFDEGDAFTGVVGRGAELQQAATDNVHVGSALAGSYAPYPTRGFHFVQAVEQDTDDVGVLYCGNDFMMLRLETEF